MSYQQAGMGHTAIENLPDIEQLTNGEMGIGEYYPRQQHSGVRNPYQQQDQPTQSLTPENYQKYIRNNSRQMSPYSGMSNRENFAVPIPQPQMQEQYEMIQAPATPSSGVDPRALNCIDVAEHINICPVCSKFYGNDRTVYIIIIVILSLICLLLLKKVLNV